MARYFHAASGIVTTGLSVHMHTQEKLCAEEIPPDLHTPALHVQITRYHTQLCRRGAQCSRPICFFAHSSAELREPTPGTSLPQDVLATARLAVAAEVARQNMVDATQDHSALQALGKAVALAVADTFALQQAAINPAQNMLLSNVMAAELLLGLLAKLHLSKKQNIKQTSSRHPGNGTCLSDELVLLQAQLQSAADLGTTNAAPSSAWALQSAFYAGQQREEVHPQPFCAESHKPWVVPSDSPNLSELDPRGEQE
ncbi:hypothetical protein WJX82_000844 [Trebouxia sp. C0006]